MTNTQGEARAKAQVLPGSRVVRRARSCAIMPLANISVVSPSPASSLTNHKRPMELVSALRVPSLPSPLQTSDASQSPISPFIQGMTRSPLAYEAIFALILSINVRELVGNGADVLVKALVNKTITLVAALLLAVLLDCATPAMPMLGIDTLLEGELRGAAGIVSGWLGQQAGDPLGWKIEERIAEWLWPRPSRITIDSAPASSRPINAAVR